MSVKCQVIMDALENLAPRYLAESWDNVGLLVGSPTQTVEKILVCLDVSEAVVEQAIAENIQMIVAHHPLIFKSLKNLRTDLPQGRVLAKLLKHDIIVFAAHTNLDTVNGGVNDVLAECLALTEVRPLTVSYQEPLVKLVIFVPLSHAGEVQIAIGKAGAGHIGNYSNCSFQVQGKGAFMPLEGTHPFVGKVGELESVDEVRIETILPERMMNKVVKAMRKAHPYEEAAYDIYPLKNIGVSMGLGRIGLLETSLKIEAFAEKVKAALNVSHVRMIGNKDREIRKVALCSGSGAEFISKAAFAGADVLVTGDVKYHEAQKALEYGLHVIDAGHFATEMPIAKRVAAYLEECALRGKWQIGIQADALSQDIFTML